MGGMGGVGGLSRAKGRWGGGRGKGNGKGLRREGLKWHFRGYTRRRE